MKKLITLIAILSLFTPTAYAGVLTQQMGIQPPYGSFGSLNSVSGTTFALDSAFNFGAGGKAVVYRVSNPVFQTNGTIDCHVYATAQSGSPTGQEMVLYQGGFGNDDDDRPNAIAIATSTNVDVSALSLPGWITFSFTNVTLATSTYYFSVINTTATPASNFVTYLVRPQNFLTAGRITGLSTSDGFTTDPTLQSSSTEPPIVCKFDDGTLIGNAYTTSSAHAANTDWRGGRFQFDTDIEFYGFLTNYVSSIGITWRIYQGSTLIETYIPTKYQNNNTSAIFFSAPMTFEAGVPYDIVFQPSANTSLGAKVTAGVSPPTDVTNAMFSNMGHVTGTPGSFTYSAGEFASISLMPNDIPAAAGGGGGSVQVPAIWGF